MAARVQKVAPGQELYKGPQTTLQGRWRSPTGMGVDDVLEYEKLIANGQEDARDEEWFQRKYGYDWYGFPEWKRMAFRKRERQKALDDYKRRLAAQIADPERMKVLAETREDRLEEMRERRDLHINAAWSQRDERHEQVKTVDEKLKELDVGLARQNQDPCALRPWSEVGCLRCTVTPHGTECPMFNECMYEAEGPYRGRCKPKDLFLAYFKQMCDPRFIEYALFPGEVQYLAETLGLRLENLQRIDEDGNMQQIAKDWSEIDKKNFCWAISGMVDRMTGILTGLDQLALREDVWQMFGFESPEAYETFMEYAGNQFNRQSPLEVFSTITTKTKTMRFVQDKMNTIASRGYEAFRRMVHDYRTGRVGKAFTEELEKRRWGKYTWKQARRDLVTTVDYGVYPTAIAAAATGTVSLPVALGVMGFNKILSILKGSWAKKDVYSLSDVLTPAQKLAKDAATKELERKARKEGFRLSREALGEIVKKSALMFEVQKGEDHATIAMIQQQISEDKPGITLEDIMWHGAANFSGPVYLAIKAYENYVRKRGACPAQGVSFGGGVKRMHETIKQLHPYRQREYELRYKAMLSIRAEPEVGTSYFADEMEIEEWDWKDIQPERRGFREVPRFRGVTRRERLAEERERRRRALIEERRRRTRRAPPVTKRVRQLEEQGERKRLRREEERERERLRLAEERERERLQRLEEERERERVQLEEKREVPLIPPRGRGPIRDKPEEEKGYSPPPRGRAPSEISPAARREESKVFEGPPPTPVAPAFSEILRGEPGQFVKFLGETLLETIDIHKRMGGLAQEGKFKHNDLPSGVRIVELDDRFIWDPHTIPKLPGLNYNYDGLNPDCPLPIVWDSVCDYWRWNNLTLADAIELRDDFQLEPELMVDVWKYTYDGVKKDPSIEDRSDRFVLTKGPAGMYGRWERPQKLKIDRFVPKSGLAADIWNIMHGKDVKMGYMQKLVHKRLTSKDGVIQMDYINEVLREMGLTDMTEQAKAKIKEFLDEAKNITHEKIVEFLMSAEPYEEKETEKSFWVRRERAKKMATGLLIIRDMNQSIPGVLSSIPEFATGPEARKAALGATITTAAMSKVSGLAVTPGKYALLAGFAAPWWVPGALITAAGVAIAGGFMGIQSESVQKEAVKEIHVALDRAARKNFPEVRRQAYEQYAAQQARLSFLRGRLQDIPEDLRYRMWYGEIVGGGPSAFDTRDCDDNRVPNTSIICEDLRTLRDAIRAEVEKVKMDPTLTTVTEDLPEGKEADIIKLMAKSNVAWQADFRKLWEKEGTVKYGPGQTNAQKFNALYPETSMLRAFRDAKHKLADETIKYEQGIVDQMCHMIQEKGVEFLQYQKDNFGAIPGQQMMYSGVFGQNDISHNWIYVGYDITVEVGCGPKSYLPQWPEPTPSLYDNLRKLEDRTGLGTLSYNIFAKKTLGDKIYILETNDDMDPKMAIARLQIAKQGMGYWWYNSFGGNCQSFSNACTFGVYKTMGGALKADEALGKAWVMSTADYSDIDRLRYKYKDDLKEFFFARRDPELRKERWARREKLEEQRDTAKTKRDQVRTEEYNSLQQKRYPWINRGSLRKHMKDTLAQPGPKARGRDAPYYPTNIELMKSKKVERDLACQIGRIEKVPVDAIGSAAQGMWNTYLETVEGMQYGVKPGGRLVRKAISRDEPSTYYCELMHKEACNGNLYNTNVYTKYYSELVDEKGVCTII